MFKTYNTYLYNKVDFNMQNCVCGVTLKSSGVEKIIAVSC